MMFKLSKTQTIKVVCLMLTFSNYKSEATNQHLSTQLKFKSYKTFCSSATLDKCLEHWFQMSEDPNKAFPVTLTDLKNTCR